jgi:hypothetical protein
MEDGAIPTFLRILEYPERVFFWVAEADGVGGWRRTDGESAFSLIRRDEWEMGPTGASGS